VGVLPCSISKKPWCIPPMASAKPNMIVVILRAFDFVAVVLV
jgi:hypothetical protein